MADDEPDEPDEWIEIRRYSDPLQAEMVKNFLREHGVRFSMRGDPGASAVLNRFATIIDIRLDVPRSQVDSAEEALAAMEAASAVEHPFRGGGGVAPPESTPPAPAPRKTIYGVFLALLFPFGAGHFYAGHTAAGTILGAGIIAGVLGGFLGRPDLFRASALLVAADVLGVMFAVKRHNEQRIPPDTHQRGAAFVAVVIAFAFALLLPESSGTP